MVFEVHQFSNFIILGMIQSLEKGQGYGREGLKFFLELAKKHRVEVHLSVKRLGKDGLKTNDLKRWYKRNGFFNRDGGMVWKP